MSFISEMMRKGWLYQATGYTVLLSFIGVQAAIIFVDVPERNRELFHLLIGIVDTAFVGNLVNHFFGSSNQLKNSVEPGEKKTTIKVEEKAKDPEQIE